MRLKAEVPNPKRLLWPNQFVNARLRLGTRQGALVVPAPAVQRGPNGTFVYVVGPDSTVAAAAGARSRRPWETLAIVGKGVDEGDAGGGGGAEPAPPGAKVAPREPGKPGEQTPPGGKPASNAKQAAGGGDGGRQAGSATR